MYEVYQDHPKQAKLNVRVVLAIAFLICAIGTGIFLITRLVSKPLTKEEARAKAGIVYDSAAVEGGWDNLSPEEIAEKLNEKVAEGMINISMNTAPYFEDSTAEGNLMIVNESPSTIIRRKSRSSATIPANRSTNPAQLPLAAKLSTQSSTLHCLPVHTNVPRIFTI